MAELRSEATFAEGESAPSRYRDISPLPRLAEGRRGDLRRMCLSTTRRLTRRWAVASAVNKSVDALNSMYFCARDVPAPPAVSDLMTLP
eukprot:4925296-Pyramimonas_sp.AAC.1